MSNSGNSSDLVGYGRPPAEHRFKNGVSGNPRGRPRKTDRAKRGTAARTKLEDLLLEEALRPIQVRDNDQTVEMPMIQAVVRSMGVAAVKGNHKAQTTMTSMVQAAQAGRALEMQEAFKWALQFKENTRKVFEECDRVGEPRPDFVPHPDDIAVDLATGKVKYNGPMTRDDKAEWELKQQRREKNLRIIADMQSTEDGRAKYARATAWLQAEADVIEALCPDEKTRRTPGFDFADWRTDKDLTGRLKRLTKLARRPAHGSANPGDA